MRYTTFALLSPVVLEVLGPARSVTALADGREDNQTWLSKGSKGRNKVSAGKPADSGARPCSSFGGCGRQVGSFPWAPNRPGLALAALNVLPGIQLSSLLRRKAEGLKPNHLDFGWCSATWHSKWNNYRNPIGNALYFFVTAKSNILL